jgi:serine/threonine-protein kinase
MADESRVQLLLDEMLDAQRTPEEICGSCPELLPEVRKRWQQIRFLDAEIEALFPPQGRDADLTRTPTPASASSSERAGENLPHVPGYVVEGVLGRGGMGVVYKARHLRLGRPVALKMLLAGAYAGPHELARFQREAEAVAGLRHPNIVQVYDVGSHEGQPYFTMEFVEGGSLAEQLNGAPRPAHQAAALLATLADAVRVAHHGGIVHRDLKPANVLLTADGLPKISDFGLARRLGGGPALTQSGAAVGTPSYMPPEQARGKAPAPGPPSSSPSGLLLGDVYALGAILYELLTGRPPFRGETAAETVLQVIYQDPVPPSRLNARVPRDLEVVCLKCLHKDPQRRYPSAAALAEDLRCFLRGDAVAARPEGRLERLARGVRRRPTLAVGLTGVLLLTAALVGGGLWIRSERAAADRAREQLDRQERARRDQAVAARLAAVRLRRAAGVQGNVDRRAGNAGADQDYESAFRAAGFGAVHDDPGVVAARVGASSARDAVVAALDDWAVCATDAADKRRLGWVLEVARRADADPSGARNRLRDPAAWKDPAALAALAKAARAAHPSVPLLVALGERWRDAGGDAVAFLTQVQQEYPGDFWANMTLGDTLRATRPGEAVRYYQAALAVQPGSAVASNNLGTALAMDGRVPEAVAHFQRALRQDPTLAAAHSNLGHALSLEGRHAEALGRHRQAVRLRPHDASTHANLGAGLAKAGRADEAVEQFQEALRLDPSHLTAHTCLGVLLLSGGRPGEAIEHHRSALRINPHHAIAHMNLGCALQASGRVDEALVHYREAVRLGPGQAVTHTNLGNGLTGKGQFAEAVGHYREALRIDPRHGEAHARLADALTHAGRPGEALRHYRQAARLQGGNAKAHYNLALALSHGGRVEESVAPFEQALRIDPRLAEAHGALGLALLAQGRLGEAKAAIRRCLGLLPPGDPRRAELEKQVRRCDGFLALEGRLPAVLGGKEKPASAEETIRFAHLCRFKGQFAAAAAFFADACALKPHWAEEPRTGLRYCAARYAARAGCARAGEGGNLDAAARLKWRVQARCWLWADLAAWDRVLKSDPAGCRAGAQKTLTRWGSDPDLAGLREPVALAKLPAEERKECRALWKAVGALLEQARAEE